MPYTFRSHYVLHDNINLVSFALMPMIFLSFMRVTLVVIPTSCISSSVIVHFDQSFIQNSLSRYGIVSLQIMLILVPSIN